jgi:exodeoxyribonuclease VII large subunit
MEAAAQRRQARIDALGQVLAGLSYRSVLARGFALVRDAEGAAVRTAAGLLPGTPLSLEFADGQVRADVHDGLASRPRPKPGKPVPAPAGSRQGSLF